MSEGQTTPNGEAPTTNDVVQDLHAAASDLRFVASGGQCDPRTLAEHADALLAAAAALASRSSVGASERDALDAARYRYLRDRLWVRSAKSLAGNVRPALQVAIARSFLPDGTPVAMNPDELDAAIDTARAALSQEARP